MLGESDRRYSTGIVNGGRDATATWSALTSHALFDVLDTSPAGLPSDVAAQRLRRTGPNEVPAAPPVNLARLLLAQVMHTLALLLWAAAVVAFLARLPQIGWAIVAIILINGGFSYWQEYRASQLVAALRKSIPRAARVLRDGAEHRIPAREIVPGDLIILRAGERVPADARLIEVTDLRLDYSILTGEAEPVERTAEPVSKLIRLEDAPNCALAGSTVVRGAGVAAVFATGASSVFGDIALRTERAVKHVSPLHQQLNKTARTIAVVAVFTGVIFFAAGNLLGGVSTEDSFIFSLGILVALIPEGLLPTVSLALALGVQRMSRRHALVKQLASVDTLGCTDLICTDKTGTITLNEMTTREVWVSDTQYHVTGRGYALRGRVRAVNVADGDASSLHLLLECAVLCNDGIPPQPRRHRAGLGDPLDEALLVLAMKAREDPEAIRASSHRLREFPFDAARRLMSTVNQCADGIHIFVKGGPAEVLDRCVAEQAGDGVRLLTTGRRAAMQARVDAMTEKGQRILAFASRRVDIVPAAAEEAEAGLVFLGMVGLDNPLRPEVPAAVRRCHQAGIDVVMLTGDHAQTALSVAAQAGIVEESNPGAVTGSDIDGLTDDALDNFLSGEGPRVFARVTPDQKLRLVHSYRRLGKVVAVTGDGVNDAPALRAADIGVAMGKRGTDVAREAADMILLDDNFATIVTAVEEGRAVYANIRKFLTYFLTSNVAEALPFVAFVLFGVPLPLTVLQVLLIDLGTDLLPGLALGVEGPEPGTMKQKPRGLSASVVTRGLLVRALGWLGMLAALLGLTGYFIFQWDVTGHLGSYVEEGALYRQATTITFLGIVACQVGNAFACRSERTSLFRLGLKSNRALLFAIAAEMLMVAVLIAAPPLRDVFDLEPIEPRYWPMLAAFPFVFLGAEELRKLIVVHWNAHQDGAHPA